MCNEKRGQEPAFAALSAERSLKLDEQNTEYYLNGSNGMSKREYAAIQLRFPDSGEEWLDEMIRNANLRDAACAAMSGLLSNQEFLELCRIAAKHKEKNLYAVVSDAAHEISCFFISEKYK